MNELGEAAESRGRNVRKTVDKRGRQRWNKGWRGGKGGKGGEEGARGK